MVYVLRIKDGVSAQSSLNELARIGKQLPRMGPKTMKVWGNILERDMKFAARRANIKEYTGGLYDTGIQYRQRTNGRIGMLFIRQYGVMLDSMKTHVVSIHRRRSRLLHWASQAQKVSVSKNARLVQAGLLKNFPVVVRAHPFIRAGWNRARRKLRPLLKQNTKRIVRGGSV